ncbi:hypothetical protein GVN20_24750 [Runella sp. CRIBMP]|uniref:hypothetical protein n=1 Tax=Runella sp. CRIBMP TaxID=2683261 RepID=UPI0014127C2D|nr:hypothetical protein [Runella sp. CRIBMP]NBB22587.1 hypothetical protein [Runella sp. CRIBMP]
MEKIIIAHFTEREMSIIQSNIQELSQTGRMGNADSIAMRFDAAIARAKKPETPSTKVEDNANAIPGDNPEEASGKV